MGQRQAAEPSGEGGHEYGSQRTTFNSIINTIEKRPIVLCCGAHGDIDGLWTENVGRMTAQHAESFGNVSVFYDPVHGSLRAEPYIPQLSYFFQNNRGARCMVLLDEGIRVGFGAMAVPNAQLRKKPHAPIIPGTGRRAVEVRKRFSAGEIDEQPRTFMIGIEYPKKDAFGIPSQVTVYGKISQRDLDRGVDPSVEKIEITREIDGLPLVTKCTYESGKGGTELTLTQVQIAGKTSARQVSSAAFLVMDEYELSPINGTPMGNVHDREISPSGNSLPVVTVRETIAEWIDKDNAGISFGTTPSGTINVLLKLLFYANRGHMASNEADILPIELRVPFEITLPCGVITAQLLNNLGDWSNRDVLKTFQGETQRILSAMP